MTTQESFRSDEGIKKMFRSLEFNCFLLTALYFTGSRREDSRAIPAAESEATLKVAAVGVRESALSMFEPVGELTDVYGSIGVPLLTCRGYVRVTPC